MSGGTFANCPNCGRLNIYGATCSCGQRTDLPAGCTERECIICQDADA